MAETAFFRTLRNTEVETPAHKQLIKTLQWGARLAFLAELGSHFRQSIDDATHPTIVDYFCQDSTMAAGIQLVPKRYNTPNGQIVDWQAWEEIATAATLTRNLAIQRNLCMQWAVAGELGVRKSKGNCEIEPSFHVAFSIARFQKLGKRALLGRDPDTFITDAVNVVSLTGIPARQKKETLIANLKNHPTFFDFLVREAFPCVDDTVIKYASAHN